MRIELQSSREAEVAAPRGAAAPIVTQQVRCYTRVSTCSDAHGTDRKRTTRATEFPFNRLISVGYAWPLRCTKLWILAKQNNSWARFSMAGFAHILRVHSFGEEKR